MPKRKSYDFLDTNLKSTNTSLESIVEQIKDLNFSDFQIKISEEIIGNIDEDGYLSIEPILIADRLNVQEIEKIGSITGSLASGTNYIYLEWILFITTRRNTPHGKNYKRKF